MARLPHGSLPASGESVTSRALRPPRPLWPPAIARLLSTPLSRPFSAPSDEADEVTAVTPKTPDQSNDETPAPASATDAAAKTAAPSWRPRSPSPSSALSPSPPRKRRKTDGEEAQSEVPAAETAPPASRKRRHSVTGSGTDGGRMTAAQRLGIRVRRGRGRVLRRVGRRGRMDS